MLKGAFNTSRHAADHFRRQESGCLIHMTSTSGLVGAMGQVNYGAAKLGMAGLSKNIAIDMQRFNVRSNCIAPVAWTRMTASIPARDPESAKRVDQRKQVTAEHNAPLAVFLASDAAKEVTGQVFSVRRNEVFLLSDAAKGVNAQVFATRKNEIFLMSQSRPLRSIHRSEGWTPETCADHMLPALKSWFFPLDRTADVFPWDSI
jgi:short-subunit dehydrogenase